VLYIGKAQEKARVKRTKRRRCAWTGATYPWIVESTAMVNHYHFYCVDEDLGPFFLKFCSYFPYNAKLCINGHEYLKRQLAKWGAFEALDDGIKSCADPQLQQRLSDGLTAEKIDRLLRKWLRRLPHTFPARDRAAGYRYRLSILQAEFSLTQVLDHPVTGHAFIERIPNTHRYRITAKGLRTAIFYMHLYNRSMRTGLAVISPHAVNVNLPIARSIRAAEAALKTW
jgi:hypothetical protein